MRAIDFLKQKGFDVEPDIHTNLQRELHFTGNEIAYLMESYAMQVNGVDTSHDQALNLAGVSASFLAHLEMQLNYHKRNEQNKREMGDYEKAMYHRDRGGAIEDLIIHIKNAR